MRHLHSMFTTNYGNSLSVDRLMDEEIVIYMRLSFSLLCVCVWYWNVSSGPHNARQASST
jgi:hypothetical protein